MSDLFELALESNGTIVKFDYSCDGCSSVQAMPVAQQTGSDIQKELFTAKQPVLIEQEKARSKYCIADAFIRPEFPLSKVEADGVVCSAEIMKLTTSQGGNIIK